VLHLTEHAAYGRIEAARAARKFPVILERLHDGTLTLTAVCLLGPHLTAENHLAALDAARHKSKAEVERQVASLRPQPDVPATVRKLPTSRPAAMVTVGPSIAAGLLEAPNHRDAASIGDNGEMKPLAPERFKIQFTINRETHEKLQRVRAILRHSIPSGDLETLFDRAITLLLEDAGRKKFASTGKSRVSTGPVGTSRHIPAAVRRAVWVRDAGQCAFRGARGRCSETNFIEFHHVVPFAAGGEMSVQNLELRCRAHNAYEADLFFGWPALGPDRVVQEWSYVKCRRR
jgi:hypothetical protein